MSRRKRFTRNLGRTVPSPLPRRTTCAWVRFEHVSEPYGLFSYMSDAEEELEGEARRELDTLLEWFGDFLDAPVLAADARDRFWFRAEAEAPIVRARRVMELMREAGIPIVERRTTRIPGKITWEDRDQVSLLTYRDAPRP